MGEAIFAVLAGGAVLALIAGAGSVVVDVVMKGTKLTADGTVSLDGKTPADPTALAAAAGMTLDAYALARMVESEAGGLPQAGKIGVAFAAENYAANVNRTISGLLLRSNGAGHGFFGRQDQGRYASTSRDPSLAAISVAEAVIDGLVDDPTGGADQWDSPWSYKDSADETAAEKAERVARARMDAGKEKVILADVPERKLRFWRAG